MSDATTIVPPTQATASLPSDQSPRSPESLTLDVVVTRAGVVESRHRVHAAVVRFDGLLLASAHNADLHTWWRSCAKPFQVMPMIEDGSFDALGWGDEELALACASHGSEPEHVRVATSMLARVGLTEDALACGPHEPLSARGAALLHEVHAKPTRIHSNCSGKHAAMLARAVSRGWTTEGYQLPTHPVQEDARRSAAQWTGVPATDIGVGIDGCGVPVFALTLRSMALAYARLAHEAHTREGIPRRIVNAMTSHAHLVGGTDRFDTLLMQAGQGNLVAKVGAEGVHSVGVLDAGIGIAIKVEDGAPRAQYPAVLACLQVLGALPARLPESLMTIALTPLTNTRDEMVGAVFVPGHEVVQHV